MRAVVVDEVHAFAGDDRGWHLLAVLERLTRLAGRPLQRIGLSATVGNPDELLTGCRVGRGQRARRGGRRPDAVARPADAAGAAAAATSSWTTSGSLDNAATVIAALHRGEKRLVFCESRRQVEELGARAAAQRESPRSCRTPRCPLDERRRAEQAFAEARDCVIVATSTLELGIDVGDLDRVIQIDAPRTVASFLQRMGRTGRRPGGSRNCLFLALDDGPCCGRPACCMLWGRGCVEPVAAPPEPRHIVAQQLLALCLQEHRVGDRLWAAVVERARPVRPQRRADPAAPGRAGLPRPRRRDAVHRPRGRAALRAPALHGHDAVFTAPPQFTVLAGRRRSVGSTRSLLTEEVDGPRLLLLGGRSWQVTWTSTGSAGAASSNPPRAAARPAGSRRGVGRALATRLPGHAGRAARRRPARRPDPAGRADPGRVRDERPSTVHPGGTVITRDRRTRCPLVDLGRLPRQRHPRRHPQRHRRPLQRFDDASIRLRADLTREHVARPGPPTPPSDSACPMWTRRRWRG